MVSKPSGSVCTYHHSVLTTCKHFKSRVNAGDSAIQLQGKTMRQAAALENPKVSDWRWPDPVGWAQLPLTFQNVSCFRIRMLLSYFYSDWTEMLLSYVNFQVIYLVLQNKDIMFTLLKVCILKLAQVCIFCKKFEFETTLILSLSPFILFFFSPFFPLFFLKARYTDICYQKKKKTVTGNFFGPGKGTRFLRGRKQTNLWTQSPGLWLFLTFLRGSHHVILPKLCSFFILLLNL